MEILISYLKNITENFSTTDDVVFWSAFLLIIIVCLFLWRKRLLAFVSNSKTAYLLILLTVLGVLIFVLLGKVSSKDNVHPILEVVILCLTAVLTFLAFWVQYNFNSLQKKDIVRDRFENRFYNNLDLLLKLEEGCVIPYVGAGKQAFHFMFYEYKAIMSQVLISDKVEWMSDYLNSSADTCDRDNSVEKTVEREKFWKKVNQISFNIFLSGVSTSAKTRLYEDCGVSKEQIDSLNKYFIDRQHVSTSPMYLDDYNCTNIRLYDGHRLRLVAFFRLVCMIVQYVIKEADKTKPLEDNHYLLSFLSVLSEHEISLLYIIYHYSTEEHKLFTSPNKEDIDVFFCKILPKFIMASNLHPNDKDHNDFLNMERINMERKM